MPQKKGYTKTKRAFARQYGKRSESVFYATLNAHTKMRRKLTGSATKIGGKRKRRS